MTRVHAFTEDALGDLDATGVAERIASGEVTAGECAEAAIVRLERVNPALNAVEFKDFPRARERVNSMDGATGTLAAFHGVPTATKNNIHVAGMPLTEGSAAIPPTLQTVDGPFTQQFLSTGLVPIASTTMPEYGWSASTERSGGSVTRNPWHTDFSAGGSSGGSAALVAAGVVPIAHGNDGGGSIRIPAAVCGLVGLKPSRGRLLGDPSSSSAPVKIVADGVLVRSVRDCARFFEAAEQHYRHPKLTPIGRVDHPLQRRLRIGLCMDSPFAPATDPATRQAVDSAAKVVESLGHTVEPYIPAVLPSFKTDFEDYWSFLAFAIAKGGSRMFDGFDASRLDPLTLGLSRRFVRRSYRAPLFLARLAASARVYERGFANVDAVLTPVLTHTTPRIGYLTPDQDPEVLLDKLSSYVGFTPLHNACGAPAISLPLGQDPDGLPIGVMFSGQRGSERTLLELALEIEEAQPFSMLG
ncbi:amidase [Mycobacterium sp. CBMA271]|uniref:amidase n=1 Tax=unclassified Mycobacteroides TaxID=2618759 RepID=UPI0012DC1068|nr:MULTISPECIES: amidase [unclassified Mycobacteroides]MUM15807.1 amidase [Mycobacteroides sp. CBMA 326]MUM24416.1 amidase [Mycobacteroides sp. CBMA 271]